MFEGIKLVIESLDGSRIEKDYKNPIPLRYGENWDTKATLYLSEERTFWVKHSGKDLSLNNFSDIFRSTWFIYDVIQNIEWLKKYDECRETCVAIFKHSAPCGVSLGGNLANAYQRALMADQEAAFGGTLATNEIIDESFLEKREELKRSKMYKFIECLVAPGYEPNTLRKLKDETKDMRIIQVDLDAFKKFIKEPQIVTYGDVAVLTELDYNVWNSNLLKQGKIWDVVTERKPTNREAADAILAWIIAKHLYSNAFAYVRNGRSIGVCGGQPHRERSGKFACETAKMNGFNIYGEYKELSSATDSFFPFSSGIELLNKVGSTAHVNPGRPDKQERDVPIINAANNCRIALMLTRKRVFRHSIT